MSLVFNSPHNISRDLEIYIFEHSSFEDFLCYELVNKVWNKIVQDCMQTKYIEKKENYFANKLDPNFYHFPSEIIQIFGGAKKVYLLPILTDKTRPSINMDAKIMRGAQNNSSNNCAFIAFKILIQGSCKWQRQELLKNTMEYHTLKRSLNLNFSAKNCSKIEFISDFGKIKSSAEFPKCLIDIQSLVKNNFVESQEIFWFKDVDNSKMAKKKNPQGTIQFSLEEQKTSRNCTIS